MLTELSIHNIAIIEQLTISFGTGLNILTGETGAGKSIIIDALGLICGGRASADLIRTGEDEARVEALFDLRDHMPLRDVLREAGFDLEDELLIKRQFSRSGRNRIYLNGSLATLGQLSEIGRLLVTIHGQHESQSLLRPEFHLTLLDAFAGCAPLRQAFAEAYTDLRRLEEQLAHFDEQDRETARRLDMVAFQTDEIVAARLRVGEEQELEELQRLLANAERLSCSTGSAYESLYGGDQALLGELKRVTAAVRDATAYDPALAPLSATLEEGYLQLEDAALQLRDYASRIEADPEQLREVEDRLDLLQRLKRKYAPTIEEIINLGISLEAELEELRSRSRSRSELEEELSSRQQLVRERGTVLTEQRRAAATRLEQELGSEIRQLAMPHAVIRVSVETVEQPRSNGYERVEFLFSPNPGELPRALGKVASGGELSRLMLAFKQILPEGEAPTLIFDEVDTGVGGAVADTIGRKLWHVALKQQVFCVTHLPQVAAWAGGHHKVEKQVSAGRTSVVVTSLNRTDSIDEIARMLAGEHISAAARDHARELVEQAEACMQ